MFIEKNIIIIIFIHGDSEEFFNDDKEDTTTCSNEGKGTRGEIIKRMSQVGRRKRQSFFKKFTFSPHFLYECVSKWTNKECLCNFSKDERTEGKKMKFFHVKENKKFFNKTFLEYFLRNFLLFLVSSYSIRKSHDKKWKHKTKAFLYRELKR